MSSIEKNFRSTDFKTGPQILTITAIDTKRAASRKTEPPLPTICFRETKRRVPLTKRRAHVLKRLFGKNIAAAKGKRIELFRDHGMFKGSVTAYVGLRSPKAGKA